MTGNKRIYIFLEHYYPKSQSISAQLISELADGISEFGHEIFLIVPDPNVKFPFEIRIIKGQKVVFFKSPDTKKSNRILRALSELLLSLSAYISLRDFIRENPPEYILYLSPTIFYGPYLNYLKKNLNIKSYLILRDIFPQWAVEVGLIKENSFIHKFFKYFEELNYSAANHIGLEAPSILNQFNQRQVAHAKKTELLFNWVRKDKPNVRKEISLREKYGLKDELIFFYGGNIGVAQDVQNIVRLAENMKNITKVVFIIIGNGTERKLIHDLIFEKKLDEKIIFDEGVSNEIFMDYITEVDVGLISLNKNNRGHNIPGKILNYCRFGIPILGSVNQNNDIINIINENNAGIVVTNGDDSQFFNAAKHFLDKSFRAESSVGSKGLVEKLFSVDVASNKILEKIL